MQMSVCRVYVFLILGMLGLVTAPATASAQYRPAESGAIAENYHIEASFNWWNAEPSLIVNSESLGILGDDINLIADLLLCIEQALNGIGTEIHPAAPLAAGVMG